MTHPLIVKSVKTWEHWEHLDRCHSRWMHTNSHIDRLTQSAMSLDITWHDTSSSHDFFTDFGLCFSEHVCCKTGWAHVEVASSPWVHSFGVACNNDMRVNVFCNITVQTKQKRYGRFLCKINTKCRWSMLRQGSLTQGNENVPLLNMECWPMACQRWMFS